MNTLHFPFGHPWSCGNTFGQATTLDPSKVTCYDCQGEMDRPSIVADALAGLALFRCSARQDAVMLLDMWSRRAEMSPEDVGQTLAWFPQRELPDAAAALANLRQLAQDIAPQVVADVETVEQRLREAILGSTVEADDAEIEEVLDRIRMRLAEGRHAYNRGYQAGVAFAREAAAA